MSEICASCHHEMHRGTCQETLERPNGSYPCLCPDGFRASRVKIVIPEDVWNFYCNVPGGTGEDTIEKVLRRVMGLFQ